jgi:hypothetical protein
MGKSIDIYSAITNLPDSLITPQIYQAAVEEGNIKVLNVLPEEYLTEENINNIIQKTDKDGYSWHSFNLSNIPLVARTQAICETAVKKEKDNYKHVPEDKRTTGMLCNLIVSASNYLNFMSLVPEQTWNNDAVYEGIRSIYYGTSSNRNSDKKEDEMRMIQAFLYHVPTHLKGMSLYLGLFDTSMNVRDIDSLTPDRFKDGSYYLAMAKRSIKSVPLNKIGYDVMLGAIKSDKNHESDFWGDWREKNTYIKEKMIELLDSKMVDAILKRWPDKLSSLPEKYQTKKRLLLALGTEKDSRMGSNIYSGFDVKKFDTDICKAIIKLEEYNTPEFSPEIWTPEFGQYCIENAKKYRWFDKMPQELQTQEIADAVIEQSIYNISHVRPDLISYDMAVKAYLETDSWNNNRKLEEYVPKHYLDDFVLETGLPKEFFGGETSYSDVKDKHKKFTYFTVGECYIGYYEDKDGSYTYNRLIMTRRSPMTIKPAIVFNRTVGTFHKTWLEKMVSDNDSQFIKPEIQKGLKGQQLNLYMGVKQVDVVSNIKINAHTFLGETICYSGSYMQRNNLEELKAELAEVLEQQLVEA